MHKIKNVSMRPIDNGHKITYTEVTKPENGHEFSEGVYRMREMYFKDNELNKAVKEYKALSEKERM